MIEYIEIRSTSQNIIGVIDTAESIIWRSSFYGVGDWEMYLPFSWQNYQLLQIGYYVSRPDKEEAGIIERIEISFNREEGRMIIASGRMLKSLLDRRIIYNRNLKHPYRSIYPSTLSGNVEEAVKGLVRSQLYHNASRHMPIIFSNPSGSTKIILKEDGTAGTRQVTYENLLTYTDALLQEYEMSAYIGIIDGRGMVYTIREGIDRSMGNTQGNDPVIFSQDYDSLLTSSYVIDGRNEKTYCVIGGEGEGSNRFVTEYPSRNAPYGMARKEIFIDASSMTQTYNDADGQEITLSDSEYSDILNGEGKNVLTEYPFIETFNGTLDVTLGAFKVGEHFNLGDIVTIQDNELGIYMNRRILVITEFQDETGYTIECEYGV